MTKIEKLTNLLAGILDHFASQPDKENVRFITLIKDKFGFEKEFGWNKLLNAIYLLQDTELAKKSFRKFSLQGPSSDNDIGERYLRLYGILNAYCLQKDAAINLVEVFKIKDKTQVKNDFDQLNIIQLRNKVAHLAAYSSDRREKQKIDVYELHQFKLSIGEIVLCKNQVDFEEYNLNDSMDEFDTYLGQLLVAINKKLIKKVFSSQGEFQIKLEKIITDAYPVDKTV